MITYNWTITQLDREIKTGAIVTAHDVSLQWTVTIQPLRMPLLDSHQIQLHPSSFLR